MIKNLIVNNIKFIAECGCNWKSLEEAKLMILKTKEIGGFLAKFQLYNNDLIKDSKDYEFLKSIQLDYEKAKELYDYGKGIGQEVFFTPMFLEAFSWIKRIGCKFVKIRYKDNLNVPFLRASKALGKTTFISTKIAFQGDFPHKALFCVPEYPARFEDYLPDKGDIIGLNKFHGVSDHTSNLDLFKDLKNDFTNNFYWERHCCLSKDCLEASWSSTFQEIAEVLK